MYLCLIILGTTADNPATSCAAILAANPAAQSGEYFLRSAAPGDSSVSVFCDMTLDCDGVVGGWRQLADINPDRATAQGCPAGFPEASTGGCLSRVFTGCYSSPVSFPVNGIEYSQVCGQILGRRGGLGISNAFGMTGGARTIDDPYVDGISVTYGTAPRTHIWTFAIGRDELDCPCASAMATQPPDFVGRNYFCEGGGSLSIRPLWDGVDCSGADACSCTADQGNGPPFFLRTFDSPIAEDIEARVCRITASSGNFGFILVQLYVR